MSLLGLSDDELQSILGTGGSSTQGYTPKINAGVYTPKGDNPAITSLCDREKTTKLVAEVREAKLSAEIESFLCLAAERHTRIHFGRIAEFYCHASPEVQSLMEKSGLVIVDFNKAIENGFVHLTDRLCTLAGIEEEQRHDA